MLESQDDLSIVLDHVADGVTVQGRDGRLVYANYAAARLLGFETPVEMLETPSGEILRRFEMFDEAGQPFSVDRLPGRRALAGFDESSVTLRFHVVPSGDDYWSSVHASPVRDEAGQVVFAVNVWHDVTERKRAEHRQSFLAEAGELLASSLDIEATLSNVAELSVPRLADWCAVHLVRDRGALAQLTVVHADPERTAWARRLQERYPTDPNATHGVPNVIRTGKPELISVITDEMLVMAAQDEEHLELARRVGLRSAIIVPLVARSRSLGAITFASAESGREYGEDDLRLAEELARRAAIAIDNARLYDAERAARARAEDARIRFGALFEGMPDAILVLDDDDAIIDVNAGACDLLLCDRAKILGRRMADLAPAGDAAPAFASSEDLEEWRGTADVRRADGESIPVELWRRRLELPSGMVSICAMRDISELRAAEKVREEVLAAVSHDLRNPIGVIKAHVQLLQRSLARGLVPDIDRLNERLAMIEAMSTRMNALLEDMSVVARLQRGEEIQFDLARTDLVALVRRCVGELSISMSREIAMQAEPPTLVGEWDARGLERVVYNLLGNALKYSPDGGRVEARVTSGRDADDSWAEVVVEDHGIGIPEGDIPRIFDAYHRAGNVGQIRGTGIGLAGARHIIERQGGRITVTSQEGQGTTVTVRLPVDPPETA